MFIFNTSIKLYDTDSAGLLFFGSQFRLIHDAFEAFLEKIGFDIFYILNHTDFMLPYVHLEADLKKTLHVGDKISIHVCVEKIGNTSFTMSYKLFNVENEMTGFVKAVHVSIGQKTHEKMQIPEKLRHELDLYVSS